VSVYEQIKDDLGYLQMDRAAEVFATLADDARTSDWTHIEFLARLIGEQADATRNRRLAARLRFARFPFRKTISDFDFEFQPTIDRRLVDDLATLRFMDTGRPILFLGQPGCGKTHLAVALATLAVEAGFRGYFTNAEEMVANIAQATREGNLASKLKTYTGSDEGLVDIPCVGLPHRRGCSPCRRSIPMSSRLMWLGSPAAAT
jgi:DNA replication protein DnaC